MTNSFDEAVKDNLVGSDRRPANIRDYPLVTPDPPDEEEKKVTKRTVKLLLNSQEHIIAEYGHKDGTSSNVFFGSKGTGIGSHYMANGDLVFNAGSNSGGHLCGGRIVVNARGGQIIKSGTHIAEYTAAPGAVTEGTAKTNTATAGTEDKDQLAYSAIYYGNVKHEVHGEAHIRARRLTIDVQDVLTILAKEKIVLQAGPYGGGEIVQRCGSISTETNIDNKWVKSQSKSITTESTEMQYDPRASVNTVTAGHLNHKVLGDWDFIVTGVGQMKFIGTLLSMPLVTGTRKSALNIHCVRGNLSMMTNIGSMLYSAGNGPSWPSLGGMVGAITAKAKTNIKQEALVNYEAKATGGLMNLEALGVATLKGTGGVTVEGSGTVDIKSEGEVRVNGTFIRLN